MEFQYKFLSLEGVGRIGYVDEGSGDQTILFIHGLANYAGVWKKNIEVLSSKYRCIAVDLPGNGYSDPGEHSYGMEFFADCVYKLIRTLHLSDLTLAGHSMGGQVCMTLLLKYPAAASRLVLCAPAGFEQFSPWERSAYKATLHFLDMFTSDENGLRKILQSSFYIFPEQARDIVEELVSLQHRYPAKKYRAMVEACIDAMMDEPVYDRLTELQQPVLVIFGERDALIPNKLIHHLSTKELAQRATVLIPNAELHTIPQCGHFVQWEKASDVNYYIARFLEQH